MGLLDRFLEKQRQEITKQVTGELVKHVDTSLSKATVNNYAAFAPGGAGVKRYAFTQDMVNGGVQSRKKPGAGIAFETLRQFSISHEISRACINFRKRQLNAMEWSIGTAKEDDTGSYDQQISEVQAFFKQIGGRGVGYRRFMDKFVEDLLVLDAVALEKQRNRGNGLANLIPIDGATIRIRVDESGATPEPPETAYVQVIRGNVTAEFTDDEMIYAMMNSRNDTPYGLAPLESLMIIVTSSLKSGMYNLGYLTDGNIPEGLFTMPDSWQPGQIKEFQEYFDALMAGDETQSSRVKFMPPGTYVPTKKRDDMAFQEFNDWLMKITCALFEVNPIDLGFNPKSGLGGKGFVDGLQQGSYDKGLLPLAMFIEEMFTKVIQEEFGYDNLKFHFPTLKEKDAKGEAELNTILINSGVRTIDEVRTDDGLDPLPDGQGSRPFVLGQVTFLNQETPSEPTDQTAIQDKLPGKTTEAADPQAADKTGQPGQADKRDASGSFSRVINLRSEQVNELRKFRSYAANRYKANKPVRSFVSAILPLEMVETLNGQVSKAQDIAEVRQAFSEPIKELELANVDTALEARNQVLNVV